MPHINARTGEIVIRIVYDGPPEAGKTTNVRHLTESISLQRRGAAVSPGTVGERTEFFDWLDFSGGFLDGRRVRCQLVSVPGQSQVLHRRLYLLESADVVVFVSDSRPSSAGAARPDFSTTRRLAERAAGGVPIGIIVQANKQDLPGALDPARVGGALGVPDGVPVLGCTASIGDGVMETFVLAVRMATERVRALLGRGAVEETTSDSPSQLHELLLAREPGPGVAVSGSAGGTVEETQGALEGATALVVEALTAMAQVSVDEAARRLDEVAREDAAARLEADRMEAEREAAEREAAAQAEREAAAQAEREAAERAAAAQAEREAAEREAAAQAEREAAEREAAAQAEREAAERAAAAQAEREAAERAEREAAAQAEREAAEREAAAQAEREAAAQAEREAAERDAAAQAEREAAEREAAEEARARLEREAQEEAQRVSAALRARVAERAAAAHAEADRLGRLGAEGLRAKGEHTSAGDTGSRAAGGPSAPPPASAGAALPPAESPQPQHRPNPWASSAPAELPQPSELAAGHIWPPVRGRMSLATALAGPFEPPDTLRGWAPVDGLELQGDHGWVLHSATRWWFDSESAGRAALIALVRRQMRAEERVPEARALAIARDGEGWRIWMATPKVASLGDHAVRARQTRSARGAAAMAQLIERLREAELDGVPVLGGAHGVALLEGKVVLLAVEEEQAERTMVRVTLGEVLAGLEEESPVSEESPAAASTQPPLGSHP